MPIYEFKCKKCGENFEVLVRANDKPVCPKCGSAKLEKMISGFSAPKATSKKGCSHTHAHSCSCGGGHCHCGHCG